MSSSNKERLEPLVYFLDECLGGEKIAQILRQAGLSVELAVDHFARGTPDQDWLPVVGKNGWILITQDKAIRKRKNELIALRENHVRAFVVAAKGLRGEEIGELIVRSRAKIERVVKRNRPPIIATITRDGVVELREGAPRYAKKAGR